MTAMLKLHSGGSQSLKTLKQIKAFLTITIELVSPLFIEQCDFAPPSGVGAAFWVFLLSFETGSSDSATS
eukprot:4350437-Amphidinium_carterae.1